MSDRIFIEGMLLQGTHGVYEEEQRNPQPFEVSVELRLNLQPAGLADDLTLTADYGRVFEVCRQIVESTRFALIEALAEAIAHELLTKNEHPDPKHGERVQHLQLNPPPAGRPSRPAMPGS